jgi:hypothetical protein
MRQELGGLRVVLSLIVFCGLVGVFLSFSEPASSQQKLRANVGPYEKDKDTYQQDRTFEISAPLADHISTLIAACTGGNITDFNIGDTVCGEIEASDAATIAKKFTWQHGGTVWQTSPTFTATTPQHDFFTIPPNPTVLSGQTYDTRGTWLMVKTRGTNLQSFGNTAFRVHDPAHIVSDLGTGGFVSSANPAPAGTNITYLFQTLNNGPDTATNAVMKITVPTNTTSPSLTAAPGWTCPASPTGGVFTCTRASIPPQPLNVGATTEDFTLVVSVPASTPANTVLTATGYISSATADLHPNDNQNAIAISVSPGAAGLALTSPSASITTEGFTPSNGAIDPGETVTVQFSITTSGAVSNLVGTLRPTGNVTAPNGPISFGSSAGAAVLNGSFTFTGDPAAPCGSILIPSVDFASDPTSTSRGTLVFPQLNMSTNPGQQTVPQCAAAPSPQPVTVTATAATVGPTDYTTLKAAFDAINAGTHQGVVTATINSNTTETAAAVLNASGSGSASYTSVNVHPSVAGVSVTGSVSGGALVVLNGADNVTIDGSVSGGSTAGVGGNPAIRNLTVQNTSAAGPVTGVISVESGVAGLGGAQNDTIKNVIVVGQDPTLTTVGIGIGGFTAGTSPPTVNGNNTRVENCSIQKAQYGIYDHGISAASQPTGHVITRNDMTGTGTNRLRSEGIDVLNLNGVQITENSIGGISEPNQADAVGINAGAGNITATNSLSGGISNSTIARNKINGVSSSGVNFGSAVGIAIAGDVGENFVQNNMITGVTSPATSLGADLVAGIFVAGAPGSNTHLLYNSVSNTGDRGAGANQTGSFAIAITGANPVVELTDNILYSTQTSSDVGTNDKTYAIGMETSTFTNFASDFNDFFTSGANAAGFRTGGLTAGGGTDHATLAAWRTATTKDASSKSVDPLFVSPLTNLHLQGNSPMINQAAASLLVTNDFDGQTRPSGVAPEIGADEFFNTAAGVSVSGRILTSQGRAVTNATVLISDPSGTSRTVITGRNGSYRFDDVEAGRTYTVSVISRRFGFSPRVVVVTDNLSDVDLVADN